MRVELANCIKETLSKNKLPQWVAEIFGLNTPAFFSDLPGELTVQSNAELRAIQHFIQKSFTRKIHDYKLRSSRCFPHSNLIIDSKLLKALDLSVRTNNGINRLITENSGSLNMSDITYGNLIDIEAMGAKSILEFLFKFDEFDRKNETVVIEKGQANISNEGNDFLIEKINNLIIQLLKFNDLDYIYRGDPRFPELMITLPIDNYEYEDSLLDLIQTAELSYFNWPKSDLYRFENLLLECLEKINNLSSMSLDKLLKDFITYHYKRAKPDNLIAIFDRFGINEIGILTLEECGQKAGITRERIRQIESKILNSIKTIPGNNPIYLPNMENALNIIRNNLGSNTKQLQQLIYEKNITEIKISTQSVLYFAELLRYPVTDLRISKLNSGEHVIIGGSINVNIIFANMNKLYSRNGISDARLVHELFTKDQPDIDYLNVVNVIKGSNRWDCLTDDGRWWIPKSPGEISRNRLINIAEKIISVCNPVNIKCLREGFIKLATYRNSSHNYIYQGKNNIVVPSSTAILKFFEKIDGFKVDGEQIYCNMNIDYKKILGDSEKAIVESLFTSQTGLMTRKELMKAVTAQGINESTANMYLSFSPIIQHIGIDTYKLIGKEISPSALSAHQNTISEKIKYKRVLYSDWDDGLIRIVARCPEFSSTFVVGAPVNFKEFLINKKFKATDLSETQDYRTLGITDSGTIYGMSTFCRLTGIQEDDILIMKFNLLESKVYLSIGTTEDYVGLIE